MSENVPPNGSESKEPAPLEPINFVGDTIWVGHGADDAVVAVRPIVESFDVDWSSQLKRLKRHPVLSKGVVIMTTPSPGGPQETVALKLRLLPGFLFGFDANKVRVDRREKLVLYQERCFETLYRAVFGVSSQPDGQFMPPPLSGRAKFTPDEWRTYISVLREYRFMYGVEVEQWMAAQLGLPIPPAELLEAANPQMDLFKSWNQPKSADGEINQLGGRK